LKNRRSIIINYFCCKTKEKKYIDIKEYLKIILPQFIENQFFSLYFLIERIANIFFKILNQRGQVNYFEA
jgi:hypothetical protein